MSDSSRNSLPNPKRRESSLPTIKIHPLSPLERSRLEMCESPQLTPELETRRIELDIKREEHKIEDEWKCCCAGERRTDSRLIRYVVQMTIIISVMSMCIVRLSTTEDCSKQNLFLGILTLLLGIIIPQPSLGHKK